MNKLFSFLIIMILLVSGCSVQDEPENKEPNVCDIDCEIADMSEYPSLEGVKDIRFKEITYKKVLEMMEMESFQGIVYFGFPTCPWCVEAVPLLNDVAIEKDVDIYYVNKRSDVNIKDEESAEKVTELLDESFGLLVNEETNKPTLYVPEVIAIKDKEIVAHHTGTVNGHDAHVNTMNEDEIALLKSIYTKMAKKVK